MSKAQMQVEHPELAAEEAQEVGKVIKHRRHEKGNIRRSTPLAHGLTKRSSQRGPAKSSLPTLRDSAEHLQRCLKHLETLPANSAYANHRRKLVKTAMSLLQLDRERTSAEEAELGALLQRLTL